MDGLYGRWGGGKKNPRILVSAFDPKGLYLLLPPRGGIGFVSRGGHEFPKKIWMHFLYRDPTEMGVHLIASRVMMYAHPFLHLQMHPPPVGARPPCRHCRHGWVSPPSAAPIGRVPPHRPPSHHHPSSPPPDPPGDQERPWMAWVGPPSIIPPPTAPSPPSGRRQGGAPVPPPADGIGRGRLLHDPRPGTSSGFSPLPTQT